MIKVNTQLELEKQNLDIMIDNTSRLITKAKGMKTISDLKQSRNIIPFYVDELILSLQRYVATSINGKAKIKPIPVKALTLIPLELVAHFTVKTLVNHIGSKNVTAVNLYTIIARQLEIEFNLREIKAHDKKMQLNLVKYLNDSRHRGSRLTKITYDLLQKHKKDIITNTLNTTFLQVAQVAVHLLADCKPIIDNNITPCLFHIGTTSVKEFKGVSSKVLIYPSTWFLEWIRQQTLEGNLMSAYNTALIEEPKPWTALNKGGFHSKRFQNKMIKTTMEDHFFDFNEMDNTVQAVNELQKTPWEINLEVLEVMQYVFTNRLNWGGFPSPQEVQLTTYPFPNMSRQDMSQDQIDVSKAWSSHHAKMYDEYHAESSKYMAVNRALNEAKRFKQYPKFYFAYQVDFRGRVYPIASNLHPQGSEYIKSLLRFHEGKPLDSELAVKYLCVQGANTFGKDKINFNDKYQWVLDNEQAIISTGNNPYDNHFWLEADEPWLFLAFCFEWSSYKKNPKGFLSRIPVALDGSCNGLQHLSAMLLDEVGGKSVNLTANINKADIYEDVKIVTENILKEMSNPLAVRILEFGISRSTTKRPVMIVPYAGTISACRKYISDELQERKGQEFFGKDFNDVLQLLTDTVWKAIGQVIIKGREVMEWFKNAARIICKNNFGNTEISWVTPNGFQVIQKRVKYKDLLIQTSMGEKIPTRLSLSLQQATKKSDSQGHSSSISPNFIHSLDACCLQETVRRCREAGITSLAMIHDSYGTHASDSAKMAKFIREVFFEIYSKTNVLEHWIKQQPESAQAKFPELPKVGSLNLSEVLNSEHFFA